MAAHKLEVITFNTVDKIISNSSIKRVKTTQPFPSSRILASLSFLWTTCKQNIFMHQIGNACVINLHKQNAHLCLQPTLPSFKICILNSSVMFYLFCNRVIGLRAYIGTIGLSFTSVLQFFFPSVLLEFSSHTGTRTFIPL